MKATLRWIVVLGVLGLVMGDAARAIDIDLARFSTAKQKQIRDIETTLTNKVPAIVWRFFDAVRVDDWETATNLAMRLNRASGRYGPVDTNDVMAPAFRTLVWSPVCEMYGTYGLFHGWDNRWLHRYGKEIIDSIPAGSIYFGGTDPGRFIISALSESQVEGRPFFTLTQNALADHTYLDYLRMIYGQKINIPTDEDSRQAFENYVKDATERQKLGKLKPGENVQNDDGRIQVSGQVAVMEINALLVKDIFDQNPQREFYVEESFPLDWMYPYLSPHGLIFQLNREPLTELSAAEVAKDQAYWKKLTDETLGGWLDDKTSVKEVCDFADKVFLTKNLDGFKGDKAFVQNDFTQKAFSKLRSSLAGMYAWRAEHAHDADERERMQKAADLAFRQAYAMCPYSPEALWRYVNLLMSRQRFDDAILITKASLRLDPNNEQIQGSLRELEKNK